MSLKTRASFFVSQTDSHAEYRKFGNPTLNVIVPIHSKDIRYGIFRSILRQSKLKEIDFNVKLK